jgi:nicotinamidase-related amidase
MRFGKSLQGAAAAVLFALTMAAPAGAGDIIEDWGTAKAPKPPAVKSVTVSARDTALLVLDIQTNNCNAKRRPRCVDMVPKVEALLKKARAAGMPVVYALTGSGTREKVLKPVAPRDGEPHVQASVNKFHGTALEKILKDKGVKTVILVGTAAEGAVLGTATGAAARKFKVIVPVDGMASSDPYAEQYTAIYLAKGPGTRRVTTLTRTTMIEIK